MCIELSWVSYQYPLVFAAKAAAEDVSGAIEFVVRYNTSKGKYRNKQTSNLARDTGQHALHHQDNASTLHCASHAVDILFSFRKTLYRLFETCERV